MSLQKRILELKQNSSSIVGSNVILDAFIDEYCLMIDNQEKELYKNTKAKILSLLKEIDVDFDGKLLSALHEYNELVNYYLIDKTLNEKNNILRIAEESTKKPDFKLNIDGEEIYIEMKTLGYANGNLNYKEFIEDGLNAQISLEEQLSTGDRVAISERVISPLKTNNTNNSSSSVLNTIEILMAKINQNIKKGQFEEGTSMLLIDLNLICLYTSYNTEIKQYYWDDTSKISGVLWNIAFGQINDDIYKFDDFQDGRTIIDGTLSKNGILHEHDYIKGILFRVYELDKSKNYLVGLCRKNDKEEIIPLLKKICNETNTD